MISILLTDTHFGVKNNSMTWFKSQMGFIRGQFMDKIEELSREYPDEKLRIIHLGDVFDSRSSISPFIALEVRSIFEELSCMVDEIIVVCGNHDLYSPVDDKYCSLELALSNIPKVRLVIREVYEDGDDVFVPWSCVDHENVSEWSKRYIGKRVFTHTDISTGKPKMHTLVYSGHVHIPSFNRGAENIGSCYHLNFADANQGRYFYILYGPGHSEACLNKSSIEFWRFYNEDIFDDDKWKEVNDWDYIELYIKTSLLLTDKYASRITILQKNYKSIWIIPQPDELNSEEVDVTCDINSIIDKMVPEELKEKFETIKQITQN